MNRPAPASVLSAEQPHMVLLPAAVAEPASEEEAHDLHAQTPTPAGRRCNLSWISRASAGRNPLIGIEQEDPIPATPCSIAEFLCEAKSRNSLTQTCSRVLPSDLLRAVVGARVDHHDDLVAEGRAARDNARSSALRFGPRGQRTDSWASSEPEESWRQVGGDGVRHGLQRRSASQRRQGAPSRSNANRRKRAHQPIRQQERRKRWQRPSGGGKSMRRVERGRGAVRRSDTGGGRRRRPAVR